MTTMRRTLAAGLLFSFVLAMPFGGACTSFGDEARTPEPDASSVDGGPAGESGVGDAGRGDAGACGRCEGACLQPAGCAPVEFASGLPAAFSATALVASSNFVYVASQAPGALYRIPIPKGKEVPEATKVASADSISDLALSADYVVGAIHFSEQGKRVLSHLEKSSASVIYSTLASDKVAANDGYAYGAVDGALSICPLTGLYGGCLPYIGGTVNVGRLAAVTNSYCIVGSVNSGSAGIYCADSSATTNTLQLRAQAENVTALTMRGGRVYWATAANVRWASLSSGATATTIEVPLVTALTVDADDLFYTTGTTIVRCQKDDCAPTKRDILTAAPGIGHLAVSGDFVYFTHGVPGSERVGRVPRKP